MQCAFPSDVPMVPSYVIIIGDDGEHLTCGGFSLCETIRHWNFEFIVDYCSSLSLTPRRGVAGAAFMGSTHNGALIPRQAMIEDSAEEFLTESSVEGSFGLPSPKRHGMGASLASVTPTPTMKNAPAVPTMTTVPLRMETGLPFERCHAHHGANRRKPMLGSPLLSNG
jgi:hypothetical protein